mmetsp:Transcript_21581/g.38288  ORF Transcript_21581/g.38288 Transcript_21581/m.38288 type:complete len:566 (-) Transcript_21581:261-1958(-)|eukprot:CAMPEP_0197515574 /NCGR_PEP_ID=MMETSP1318-20131121/666_1 /TAXON_ID=552666 /ORGANISM="Partenskyella glossopodia, Strain RCC365" /LENGTH=565 /DNA_ID=CAMNT_0043063985 /DNA_START=109 /DNA_END=1806 /DNA_ORIENTATION=-
MAVRKVKSNKKKKTQSSKKKEQEDPHQKYLDTLHVEFRKMEGKKKKSNEATQNNIRMKTQQIDKLEMDFERLKEDLALETRQAHASSSFSSSSSIDRLKDEADEYTRKIEQKKQEWAHIKTKLRELNGKIAKKRKDARDKGGFSNSRDYNLRVQREIRRYESRLDKARIKYNEAKAHNNHLREQIENLRKDRDSYDVVFKKLTKELGEKKEEVEKLIKKANEAYRDRSAAQKEMQSISKQSDMEVKNFEDEWAALEKSLTQKNAEALTENSASRRRTLYDSEKEKTKSTYRFKEDLAASSKNISKIRKETEENKNLVTEFKRTFDQIRDATKIKKKIVKDDGMEEEELDDDQLVQQFIEAEDRNYNLFNELNDLITEIKSQSAELEALKGERDRYDQVGAGIEMDKIRKDMLTTLKKNEKSTSDMASMFEKKYENSLKLTIQMKNGIKEIFDAIGCSKLDSAQELISEGITETNMLHYLGIVEEQAAEIFDVFNKVKEAELNGDVPEPEAPEAEAEAEAPAAEGEEQVEGSGEEGQAPAEDGASAESASDENFEVHTTEGAEQAE